jgi:hypothetical protein
MPPTVQNRPGPGWQAPDQGKNFNALKFENSYFCKNVPGMKVRIKKMDRKGTTVTRESVRKTLYRLYGDSMKQRFSKKGKPLEITIPCA